MRAMYAGVTFFGAALLFWSEPMLSKQVLPLLGGSPAVWNTCVFFFQVTLLAGYAWAHALNRLRSTKLQAGLQVGLGLVGLFFSMQVVVAPTESPIGWLLIALLMAAGMPFFVLASGAPLFQRWFSRTSDANPYQLYVASNAGSFIALLAFPIALEPLLSMETQRVLWRVCYGVFLVLLALIARDYVRRARVLPEGEEAEIAESLTWTRRARWLLLAAAPSSLSLGTTTYLTTDIAPVPLLWVLPLAIYLLTFVLAFGAKGGGAAPKLWPIFGVLGLMQLFTIFHDLERPLPMVPTVLLHLSVLFLAARLCHGELAADRPGVGRLTEFYLWLSAGGALGGLFNGVLAPLLFDSLAEYPLALLGCMALAPMLQVHRKVGLRTAMAAGGGLLALWFLTRYGLADTPLRTTARQVLVFGAPVLAMIWAWRIRSLRVVAVVAGPVLLATLLIGFSAESVLEERTYFGMYRVNDDRVGGKVYRSLFHGRIMHGRQWMGENLSDRLTPMAYYHPGGPAGDVFGALHARTARADVAIVGLGVGGLAAHGRAGDAFVFYEIDPAIVRIAERSGGFTFLTESPAKVGTVVGDGRLMLAADSRSFDLLVLDAFGSDGIPVHLMTREALEQAYLPRLKESGAILWHVSNRYLDLTRVVAGLAKSADLRCWIGNEPRDASMGMEKSSSTWVLVSKIGEPPPTKHWFPCPDSDLVWTDGFSNVLQVFSAR